MAFFFRVWHLGHTISGFWTLCSNRTLADLGRIDLPDLGRSALNFRVRKHCEIRNTLKHSQQPSTAAARAGREPAKPRARSNENAFSGHFPDYLVVGKMGSKVSLGFFYSSTLFDINYLGFKFTVSVEKDTPSL